MNIKDTPCPQCKTIGVLNVEEIFYTKPIGSYSLAGVQMKLTGEWCPVLTCSACDLVRKGKYDPDRIHVIFDAA